MTAAGVAAFEMRLSLRYREPGQLGSRHWESEMMGRTAPQEVGKVDPEIAYRNHDYGIG